MSQKSAPSTTSLNLDLENAPPRHDLVTSDSASTFVLPTLSTSRLFVVHLGAALALFLATTDATIVSTSLPTIASELSATESQYTWVGVAYMLTQTAFQPLYGRISDLVGRKSLLFTSISIFAVGSLLCAFSNNISMLIASRALSGIGGGGIVSSVWVLTAEIVEVRYRAKWSQALSITWSCSALAGPLLGGLFSGESHNNLNALSWRWAFLINIPICCIGIIVLAFSLRGIRFRRTESVSWSNFWCRFDFGGLVLFMTGTSCIVMGFSFATDHGWNKPSTVALISIGMLVFVAGAFYERWTSRDRLFPPVIFNITVLILLLVSFLHNIAFSAGTFYLALFYQAVNGYSPLEAGLRVLPYSLGSSLASLPVAWFIGSWQNRKKDTGGQNFVISGGLLLSTLGFALLLLVDEHASMSSQITFTLISGIGLGALFHAPYGLFQHAIDDSELATSTSAFFLVRFTGATIGLALAGAVFQARMESELLSVGLNGVSSSSAGLNQVGAMFPPALKEQVVHMISRSIQTVWMFCSPCLGFAFLVSLFLRKFPSEYSTETSNADPEKTERTA